MIREKKEKPVCKNGPALFNAVVIRGNRTLSRASLTESPESGRFSHRWRSTGTPKKI
jgi:hypothetical protein